MSRTSPMIRSQRFAAVPLGRLVMRAAVAPLLLLCVTTGIRAPFWQAPELKGPVESSEYEEAAAFRACNQTCRRTVADPTQAAHRVAPTISLGNTAPAAHHAADAGWLRNDLPAPLLC